MVHWELWFSATAQHHKMVLYNMWSLTQEKIKIQSMVSTECQSLLHHHKVKKYSQTINLEAIYIYYIYSLFYYGSSPTSEVTVEIFDVLLSFRLAFKEYK